MNFEKKYYIVDIIRINEGKFLIKGDNKEIYFNKISTIEDADNESLIWISDYTKNKSKIIEETKARFIITGLLDEVKLMNEPKKNIILVENPRLLVSKLLTVLFTKKINYNWHRSVIIKKDAIINPKTYIGPNVIIGKSEIGEGCIINENVVIYDNCKLGKNIIIKSGAIIGSDGFGFIKNEDNEYNRIIHIGGVIIEDDVEIGANTCIDRGTLGNTRIGKGSKIDNLVQIAHNVIIGKNCILAGNCAISGGVEIQDNSWISPAVSIKDKVKVKAKSIIGIGAILFSDSTENSVMIGNPAEPIENYIRKKLFLNKKLRKNK